MTAVLWHRRDLRLADLPARCAAVADGPVLPLFVLDPALWRGAGPVRQGWLAASVLALDASLDGGLCLRRGDPGTVVPEVAASAGAASVHVSRETTPAGVRRDDAVATALRANGSRLVATGTPYAVGPGLIVNGTGGPYRVFTPFSRAWRAHGWPDPAASAEQVEPWSGPAVASDPAVRQILRDAVETCPVELPPAGETAALARWREFRDGALAAYDTDRDRPDLDGTSRLSPHLKVGAIHPRTLLADVAGRSRRGVDRFVSEIAWREFYADVLWRNPRSVGRDLRDVLSGLTYDAPEDAIEAWRCGKTGYPFVDAGMRQLRAEGWMHNRVRMIVASFLTKDLHVWWPVGARHFMDWLIDGDVASNTHGWQWVAGTGTDAAPYFRVFNPVTQGLRFDPSGDYVRRWVPELAQLPGGSAHEPWNHPDGYAAGYPARIVDHAEERAVALARLKGATS